MSVSNSKGTRLMYTYPLTTVSQWILSSLVKHALLLFFLSGMALHLRVLCTHSMAIRPDTA